MIFFIFFLERRVETSRRFDAQRRFLRLVPRSNILGNVEEPRTVRV